MPKYFTRYSYLLLRYFIVFWDSFREARLSSSQASAPERMVVCIKRIKMKRRTPIRAETRTHQSKQPLLVYPSHPYQATLLVLVARTPLSLVKAGITTTRWTIPRPSIHVHITFPPVEMPPLLGSPTPQMYENTETTALCDIRSFFRICRIRRISTQTIRTMLPALRGSQLHAEPYMLP